MGEYRSIHFDGLRNLAGDTGLFFILSRRKSCDFFEGADKIGIVIKSGNLTGFGDTVSPGQQTFGQSDPLNHNILKEGGTRLFFKQMAQIKFVHGKSLRDPVQCQRFGNVPIHIMENGLHLNRYGTGTALRGIVIQLVDKHKQLDQI